MTYENLKYSGKKLLTRPLNFPIYSEGIGKKIPKIFKKEGNNMYNYYQPQPQTQYQQRTGFLKGRPVSSLEEARGTAIDFDGSIFYFPDLANNRIYTKQINFDGTASLCMYELTPIEPQLNTDYITRKEFEETLAKLFTPKQQPVQEDNKKDFQANF